MSGLIVALLILGVVIRLVSLHTLVPPSSCGGTFFDGFDGKLDSGWKWFDPSGNAIYRLTTAGLSLSTPAHSDITPGSNFNPPRFLRPITGNFTIETRLEFRPNTNFQSAGLLLWQSPTTFMRIARGVAGPAKESGVFIQTWDQGTFSNVSTSEQHPTRARVVELRIQRQGDHFTASWREPGHIWQPAGETDLHFESLMVGVDLVADYNASPITASYNYFKVSCT